jgi:hypothetical protein
MQIIAKTSLLCVLVAIAAPSNAASVTFTDTSFNTADYTLNAYSQPSVTTTLGQTASGNPGTALEGTYSSTGGNSAGVLYVALNNGFVYDPSSQGAITALSASLDRYFVPILNDSPINVGSYSLRVFAEQGGNLYQAIYTFGPTNQPGGDWYTGSQSSLLASDFKLFDPANFGANGTATGLDFSGGAITFGFAMRAAGAVDGNGNPVDGPASGVLRADNFRIAINAVPEPATWAMMIAGFAIAGAAARRRGRPSFA